MTAPRGNQFWKLRKDGYNQKFDTPAKLWTVACEYFDWIDKNPLISVEIHGKDASRRNVPRMRPYTLQALFLYMGVNHSYFSDAKERLRKIKSPTKLDKEMLYTIERIEQTIYVQKFEGAAAGLLKENLIGKELGLVEKQEQKVEQNITGKIGVTVVSSGIPLANRETDVDPSRS